MKSFLRQKRQHETALRDLLGTPAGLGLCLLTQHPKAPSLACRPMVYWPTLGAVLVAAFSAK